MAKRNPARQVSPRSLRSAGPKAAVRSGGKRSARRPAGHSGASRTEAYWIYGSHAVLAALGNSARRHSRLLATAEAVRRHAGTLPTAGLAKPGVPSLEVVERRLIEELLPENAVHQGLALLTSRLPQIQLEQAVSIHSLEDIPRRVFVILDQVTDPQNCGAILRSSAAFGAVAVIAPSDRSAPESGSLAKAASGALEIVPYIHVGNLVRALRSLKAEGIWCLGLDGAAPQTLQQSDPGGDVALVLGAEGRGLRRLTAETCDLLVRLPTRGPIASLNVSNAAAVALSSLLGT